MRQVPPGTNGGVTLTGTLAGFLGSFTIALTSTVLLPFCQAYEPTWKLRGMRKKIHGEPGWDWRERILFAVAITILGGLGSVLDSLLGGWLQASVVDQRTGKVVEGSGGGKVGHSDRWKDFRLMRHMQVLVHGSYFGLSKKDDDHPSRKVESGLGLLDNNAVNLLMAASMGVFGMLFAATLWKIPLTSILS